MRLFFDSDLRIETRDVSDAPVMAGHALLTGVKSEDLGGFREVIDTEARVTWKEVVMLWNHDSAKPMARTGNESLFLDRDKKGLAFEAKPDETSWSQDAVKSVRAKTVYRNSFGFRKVKDEWSPDGTLRTLQEIEVFDVSPVTFPAYKQTRISVRASRLADLMERLDEGQELCEAELRYLRSEFPELQRALIAEPATTRSEAEQVAERIASLSALNPGRLRLAESETPQ